MGRRKSGYISLPSQVKSDIQAFGIAGDWKESDNIGVRSVG